MHIGLGIGVSASRARGDAVIRALFAAGEQGFWYDPADLSTQFQDSAGTTPVTAVGQAVGRVLDKSGRGNHLIQATGASRPVLRQDASGFYYWELDGLDDSWATADTINFSGSDKMAWWVGATKTGDSATAMLIELTANAFSTVGGTYITAPETVGANFGFLARGDLAGVLFSPVGHAAPAARVLTVAVDLSGAGRADELFPYINGVLAQTGPGGGAAAGGGLIANAPLNIGRRNNASLPFHGRLYQVIGRGGTTAATIRAMVDRDVGSRMGIAL